VAAIYSGKELPLIPNDRISETTRVIICSRKL
jgi:hypothetical protein